jgi:tRNA threonylcarbamoyladenosine biosynthesis protein TsaE
MQSISLKDAADTIRLGQKLAAISRPGDVILLSGDLGAGKTTLARGLIQAVCGPVEVPSPTYTLVQTYHATIGDIWHCDLYRLEKPEDAYELGLDEAFDEAICLIEWPDRLGDIAPSGAKTLDIQFDGDGRRATLSGWENQFEWP